METVAIIVGILIVLVVIASVPVTNRECSNKYGYKPFNIVNSVMMIVSYLLFTAMMYYGTNAPKVFYNFSLSEIVSLAIAILIISAIFIKITLATTILVGIYATFIQLVGAIIIVAFLLLFYKSKHDDRLSPV